MVIDCVGVTELAVQDTRPLDQKRGVSFGKILDHVAMGGTDPAMISSLLSRLSRLDRRCTSSDHARIQAVGGVGLTEITHGIAEARDPDEHIEAARRAHGLGPDQLPTEAQIAKAAAALIREAVKPLASQPKLRKLLVDLKQHSEQLIDDVSLDELVAAGPDVDARERERARALVTSFEQFLKDHRDEIDALEFFYSQPYSRRLRYADIKAIADAIEAPPRQWTPDALWRAYQRLDRNKVRGASSQRLLTDVVSLVRFALGAEGELVPYADKVRERFAAWLARQTNTGRAFTTEQVRWLEMMSDHVAQSCEIAVEDFDLTPFVEQGGLGRAAQVFGGDLGMLLNELNEALAA